MANTKSLLVEFGDGASPESFAHLCTINTNREFTMEASTVDDPIVDCTAPDSPAWTGRVIDTLSAGVSGEGTMDPLTYGVLRDFFLAAAPFNARVTIDLPGAQGGGYYFGSFVMTNLGIAKEGRMGTVSCSVELQSAGAIGWMDAA